MSYRTVGAKAASLSFVVSSHTAPSTWPLSVHEESAARLNVDVNSFVFGGTSPALHKNIARASCERCQLLGTNIDCVRVDQCIEWHEHLPSTSVDASAE